MFKENLKVLRNVNQMTQIQLAQKLNVSHKTISHWEKGYSEPSLEQLIKLKQLFNCSYEELLEQ